MLWASQYVLPPLGKISQVNKTAFTLHICLLPCCEIIPKLAQLVTSKNHPTEWWPWLYQLKSWWLFKQHLPCTYRGVFTPAELFSLLSIHLQWLSDQIQQGKKALPFACHDQGLRTLDTNRKSWSPPSCTTCTSAPPLTLLGMEMTWSDQATCCCWSRSKGQVSTGMKGTPALGGTTYILAHLGSHSPAS